MTHFLIACVRFAVVLGLLVFIHELGHFLVAKLCRVRVETFSLGFGRRLFGVKRGDTDYRVSVLPFGGYVKMAGDNPGEETTGDPGEFNAHPRWQRVLIALAGPAANIFLAFCIMAFVFMHHHEVDSYLSGPTINDYTVPGSMAAKTGIQPGDTIVHFDTVENPDWQAIAERAVTHFDRTVDFAYLHNGQRVDTTVYVDKRGLKDSQAMDSIDLVFKNIGFIPREQNMPVKIVTLEAGAPAQRAGLQPGDQIVSIDQLEVHSVHTLKAYMEAMAGKPSDLLIERGPQKLHVDITPELLPNPDSTPSYRLGFSPNTPPVVVDKLPLQQAVRESWTFNEKNITMIRDVLVGMFARRVSVRNLSGPVGIFQGVDAAAQDGVWTLFAFTAMISVNLAIFNLLPIPILDGGMIFFLLFESLIRRDINQVWKERIYQAAFVMIILFAAFVIFNDITKLSLFTKKL